MTVLVEDGAALERDIARDRAADDRDVAVVSYCAAAQPTDAVAPAERDVLQRKIARRAYRHQTKRGGLLAADDPRTVSLDGDRRTNHRKPGIAEVVVVDGRQRQGPLGQNDRVVSGSRLAIAERRAAVVRVDDRLGERAFAVAVVDLRRRFRRDVDRRSLTEALRQRQQQRDRKSTRLNSTHIPLSRM